MVVFAGGGNSRASIGPSHSTSSRAVVHGVRHHSHHAAAGAPNDPTWASLSGLHQRVHAPLSRALFIGATPQLLSLLIDLARRHQKKFDPKKSLAIASTSSVAGNSQSFATPARIWSRVRQELPPETAASSSTPSKASSASAAQYLTQLFHAVYGNDSKSLILFESGGCRPLSPSFFLRTEREKEKPAAAGDRENVEFLLENGVSARRKEGKDYTITPSTFQRSTLLISLSSAICGTWGH
nr:protein NUCLEAR FUSION DEFECTIVE 4-like [Ipomoea batatas]